VAGSLALAQLRQHQYRLGLAVVGIMLAVLATTLLAGVGLGVYETGERQFQSADRDLWVTAGETRITSAGGGGFENTLHDSRTVAREIQSHEGVENAAPLAFQTVYVGTEQDGELETFVGSGVPGGGSALQVTEGENLPRDTHYADGTYEGERTNAVLVDEETAKALDISVGDSLYVGGSLTAARQNEFTVVGISPTFKQMLGAPTVVMPLSELHQVTDTTQTEPATFITVTVEDDANVAAVDQDLQASYPEYTIRSNQEQLEAVLQEQILVLAAGGALILLAIVTGIALTMSLLALVVYHQRASFAALKAQGVSSKLLVGAVVVQGFLLGAIGGGLAIAVTPAAVSGLNHLAARVVGFEGLVETVPVVYAGGMGIAVGIGTIAAAIAGWRVARQPPLDHLR
jgi:putative ABC transport system permease protein